MGSEDSTLSLTTLLVIHEALVGARERCSGRGLRFVDAEYDVEMAIRQALGRGEEAELRYDDVRSYLANLRERELVA